MVCIIRRMEKLDIINKDNSSEKDLFPGINSKEPKQSQNNTRKKKHCLLALLIAAVLSLLLYLTLIPIGLKIRDRQEEITAFPAETSSNGSLLLLTEIQGLWFSRVYLEPIPAQQSSSNFSLTLFLTYNKELASETLGNLRNRKDVLTCDLTSLGCSFVIDDIHVHYYLLFDGNDEDLPTGGILLSVELKGRKTWFYLFCILSLPIFTIICITLIVSFCCFKNKN